MHQHYPTVKFTNFNGELGGEQWKRKGGRGGAERRSKGGKDARRPVRLDWKAVVD